MLHIQSVSCTFLEHNADFLFSVYYLKCSLSTSIHISDLNCLLYLLQCKYNIFLYQTPYNYISTFISKSKLRSTYLSYILKVTDVNVNHISNIETNKVKISLTLLVSICNAMNVTVDYILGNEYKAPTTAFETELLNTVDKLDSSKKEQFLRIAKVL